MPSSDSPSIPADRQSVHQRLLELALILLVCFVHAGAPPPQTNESHYLPKAKHYWEPTWCTGDPFLESADAHLTFYWSIGWLTKWFSLSTVAWIGRLAAWGAFAWSWQRLCRCVLPVPFLSVLAAALFVWLTHQMNFAGEWVVGGVEGKCFAYACVFAGIYHLAQGNWRRTWPWFGLGGAFHVLVGGWSAIAAGLAWLLEPRGQRPALLSMLPALLLGLVLALPGLVPALLLTEGVPPEQRHEAARVYVFERLPHHLAPLEQPTEYIVLRTQRFALPLLTFLLLWQILRRIPEQESAHDADRRRALLRICHFAAASFVISVLGLLWEFACTQHPTLAASLLRYYWFRLADMGVPLAATLLVCFWIARLMRTPVKLAPVALALALALPVWHLGKTTADRWNLPVPPADRKLSGVAAWQDACRWAQSNTPSDALFLVPRSSQSLSWNAERKSLVTWKDVPQDAASLNTWHRIYQDVFLYEDAFGETVPYQSLALQGTQRIAQLADKYEIDFVITREYPPLDLPKVYSNAWYTIYDVSPSDQDSQP